MDSDRYLIDKLKEGSGFLKFSSDEFRTSIEDFKVKDDGQSMYELYGTLASFYNRTRKEEFSKSLIDAYDDLISYAREGDAKWDVERGGKENAPKLLETFCKVSLNGNFSADKFDVSKYRSKK